MDIFKNYQLIIDVYYNNPCHYMSLVEILKHVVELNTWNTIHILFTFYLIFPPKLYIKYHAPNANSCEVQEAT